MKKMRRFILGFLTAVILFTGISYQANAQAAIFVFLFGKRVASEQFYLSLKIGGNLSSVSKYENSKYRFGMNFGMTGSIVLSDRFIIFPEISFLSQKGIRNLTYTGSENPFLDSLLTGVSKYELHTNYIDIPVIFKYYISEKFNIGGGPFLSILGDAEYIYENTPNNYDDILVSRNVDHLFNSIDYGLVVELAWSPKHEGRHDGMNFHLRYMFGLSNVVKNSNTFMNTSVIQGAVSFPFQVEQDKEKEEKEKAKEE